MVNLEMTPNADFRVKTISFESSVSIEPCSNSQTNHSYDICPDKWGGHKYQENYGVKANDRSITSSNCVITHIYSK